MERECLQGLIDCPGARSLILDHLGLDPAVARRLSPAVASCHHALPVAAKDRRVTVAMADPTDVMALGAITRDMEVEPFVVQGDRTTIDELLAQLRHEEVREYPRVLAYAPDGSRADAVRSYAVYVGELLGASLDYAPGEASLATLVEEARRGYELMILGGPDGRFIKRLVSRIADHEVPDQPPVSLLVVRERWRPLRKLLLVIQGNPSDHKAMDWALRLAEPSGASITALAVVPPMPAMYHGLTRMEGGLAELLTTDTTLGRQMRDVARRLVDGHVDGTLRLCQGAPNWEIRREAAEGRFDLLAVAVTPLEGVRRWGLDELGISLMRLIDLPLLIAR